MSKTITLLFRVTTSILKHSLLYTAACVLALTIAAFLLGSRDMLFNIKNSIELLSLSIGITIIPYLISLLIIKTRKTTKLSSYSIAGAICPLFFYFLVTLLERDRETIWVIIFTAAIGGFLGTLYGAIDLKISLDRKLSKQATAEK